MDYASAFTQLGLKPTASWNEVRKAYRLLIKKWHPDRFSHNNEMRLSAEEKTMEITRAYKLLADFHVQHGSLPTAITYSVDTEYSSTQSGPVHEHTADPTDQNVDAPETQPAHTSTGIPIHGWLGLRNTALLLAGAVLVLLWNTDGPSEDAQNTAVVTLEPAGQVVANTAPATTAVFTRGSKPSEVFAIQGTPTRTGKDVWLYGESKVYFSNGVVTHWVTHQDHPLKADLNLRTEHPAARLITHGTSKNEVRIIQGQPWHEEEKEWRYGSSRIFFLGDVVTGWEESDLNPLKIDKRHTAPSIRNP